MTRNFTNDYNNAALVPSHSDDYAERPMHRMALDRRSRHAAAEEWDPFASAIFPTRRLRGSDPFGMMDTHDRLMRGFGGHSFDLMNNMMNSAMVSTLDGSPKGQYQSSVMMYSSTTGADGKQHVEKYAKTSVGNSLHKIKESKEAYSNSSTGMDRLAHERQINRRGHRLVQERNKNTGEVITNDEIVGMNRDEEARLFHQEWDSAAQQYLPRSRQLRESDHQRPQLRQAPLRLSDTPMQLEHPYPVEGQRSIHTRRHRDLGNRNI